MRCCAGCIAAALSVWNFVPSNKRFLAALKGAALVCVVVVVMAVTRSDISQRLKLLFCGGLTLFALAVAVVLLALVHSRIPVVSWILELRVLTWTGRISYGLYLWHYPIAAFAFHFCPSFLASSYRFVFVFASYAIAAASYYLFEKRFLALKPKRSEPRLSVLPIGSSFEEPALLRRAV